MDIPPALIAGLGNPGAKYTRTRHNAGFWFAESLAASGGATFSVQKKFFGDMADMGGVRVLKPSTFMNESGRSIGAACHWFRIPPQAVIVAHDEADFPPGVVKLKFGGGVAGHNGLADISRVLGGPNYWRLRIGVGRVPGDIVDYVLAAPSKDETARIMQAIDRVLALWPDIVAGKWEDAMLKLHTKENPGMDDAVREGM